MHAAAPKRGADLRSDRRAPPDSVGAPSSHPAVPPTRHGLLLLPVRPRPPTRSRHLRPTRPNAIGSFPSTPRRSLAAGSPSLVCARPRPSRRACASAHGPRPYDSVIDSPPSSDSPFVAAERRRSKPSPLSLRRPSRSSASTLDGDPWVAAPKPDPLPSGPPGPASPSSPPTSRPLVPDDPRDHPPTTKRSRASEPRRPPRRRGSSLLRLRAPAWIHALPAPPSLASWSGAKALGGRRCKSEMHWGARRALP